jgi:thymidylate synthase ThyX
MMSDLTKRRVYLLRPGKLTPETIAVTFAKTSRSPLSFDEIAAELTEAKSAEFHEKWVVGYGHASVAEHAVLHIAFENVSRLAIECIESNRLASYTEKSTRYQKWDRMGYFVPEEIVQTPYEELYVNTCDLLFDAYHQSLEPLKSVIQERNPRREGERDEQWDGRTRSRYVDVARFLLPAAALANVGMTVNARALEHAIRKMLSHPLQEVREIGETVKGTAQDEVPTLVKYADAVPYLQETDANLAEYAKEFPGEVGGDDLHLIDYDDEAELRVMAAAIYPAGGASFDTVMKKIRGMSTDEREQISDKLLGKMDRFDIPLRAFEHATYTFEALLDQGAYFELKRHRIMTQTPQDLRADLGYAVPRLFADCGFEAPYRNAMDAVSNAYGELHAWNPHVAAYIVPNGHKRRVLMTLNLREAYHFCELRSQPNAHFSIRRIALGMAEMIREVHPILGSGMRLPTGFTKDDIEKEYFLEL